MDNRRSQLIVNREFQSRYILGSVLAAIVIINLALAAAFLLADSWRRFLPENLGLAIAIAVAELASLLFVAWLSLKASHRIAGPANRLSQLLDELGAGNLTVQARLRDGDCLQDVATALNTAVPALRERIMNVKNAAAALRGSLPAGAEGTAAARSLDEALAALDTKPPAKPT